MIIKSVSAFISDIPLSQPYTIAYQSVEEVKLVFFIVETSNGTRGFGSASPCREVTGESPEMSLEILESEQLSELLTGQDVSMFYAFRDRLDQICGHYPAARCAVETALLDLIGKLLDKPVFRLLGQKSNPLPTSVTVGIKSVEGSFEDIDNYLSRGFHIIKVKTGKSVQEDVEKLKKIHERFGSKIMMRVDMNQGYSLTDFEIFLEQTAGIPFDLIEQPFPVGEVSTMELLDSRIIESVAADENLHSPGDAFRLVCPGKRFGIFNIKMMKCGGPSKASQISDIADLAGVRLMWGCNDESVISIAAALHSSLAAGNTSFIDLDGNMDLSKDPAVGGFNVRDGILYPLEEPGYGVKIELQK